MSTKSLVFHINAHHDFFANLENNDQRKYNSLFTAITETYLPLLNMFANLEADGIPFKINMMFSPSLCTMLTDPIMQQSYIEWLDKLINLGEAEVKRQKGNPEKKALAEKQLQHLIYSKRDFTETLNQDIISKISYYEKRGNLELVATAATDCFLPHYIDIKEAVNAQIETGLHAHKYFFNSVPEGFWLPQLGYTPGLENSIKEYGFRYTILDSHGLLFANPLPSAGIFSPVRCHNSLVVFARDNETQSEIEGFDGYIHNGVYRDQNRDIGFEANLNELELFLSNDHMRLSTGFKYYAKKKDVNYNSFSYDENAAIDQVALDAKDFLDKKSEKLAKAQEILQGKDVSLVCTFNADTFGQTWHEGVMWLEQIFRQAATREDLQIVTMESLTTDHYSFEKTEPYLSSSSGTGYGEDLLDSTNCWMLRYIRKSCDRMIDLSTRFTEDSGLKARSLNLGAKEVLLAMASDWAKMINQRTFPEYAEKEFIKCVLNFSTLFDSLGSNSISTEWLTNVEHEHTIFPWLNYHVFSPKK